MQTVLGQEHVVELFRRILREGRLAHAYAFAGQEGVGKALFARRLSMALLCPEKPREGCGDCNVCRRIEKDTHPDVHWYAPPEGKRIFPIELIRDGLIPDISLKPLEGAYKIFIIQKAEMMNPEAANCLLKTLEEPPEGSLLILITESADRLLPTIASRCLIVRFRPIPVEIMKEELARRLGVDSEYAEHLARLSGGSFGKAIALHESGGLDAKNKFIDLLAKARREQDFDIADELISSAPAGATLEDKRRYLKACLDFLLYFYRDALLSQLVRDETLAVHTDRMNEIQKTASTVATERLIRILESILRAQEYLYMNINLNLLLEDLVHKLAALNQHAERN